MASSAADMVVVGRISGLYGVRGWVKVYSYTEPRDNILSYSPWYLRRGDTWKQYTVREGKRHGKGVIVSFDHCDDRDAARQLISSNIAIQRSQLPAISDNEYYWQDLIGLTVVNSDGAELGQVDHLVETGANDVLVVKGEREHLIPYVRDTVITGIDLEKGVIHVDWDKDF